MIYTDKIIDELYDGFLHKDRKSLAQAITLIESDNQQHEIYAKKFIHKVANKNLALRLSISGSAGVGKSTFINKLGIEIVKNSLSVAVLSIDPSSPISDGSIMADKIRMTDLLDEKNAFIRPSPAKGFLGAISKKTFLVIQLLEYFGFNIIILETVGAGQSEYLAYSLSDCFITLVQPNAGDSWQIVKKGLLELSDVIIINKADGTYESDAKLMYENFFSIYKNTDKKIYINSSLDKKNINNIFNNLYKNYTSNIKNRQQRFTVFFSEVKKTLLSLEEIMHILKDNN